LHYAGSVVSQTRFHEIYCQSEIRIDGTPRAATEKDYAIDAAEVLKSRNPQSVSGQRQAITKPNFFDGVPGRNSSR
jgi:hypothetical protein